ncbi:MULTISPECIES: hypothetical protein [Chelativorans]|jgi:hypothetical protein|uniref:hypothetical protein n=1 Tax=Chelativorans TaxID=449972 RepID=UPI00003A3A93|nr:MULTISPECIES: hypothetical protein [Chelativorans]
MKFDPFMDLAPLSVRQLMGDWRAGRIDAMTLEKREQELRKCDPAARTFFDRLGAWDSLPNSRFNAVH